MKWTYFLAFFHFICWSAVLIMVSYWIYIFTLNEDLCLVDYKNYLESMDDEPPVFTICLKNPISEDKLKINAPQVTTDTYLGFLNGSHFNTSLVDIDYQNIILNLSEHTSQTVFYWKNGSESTHSKINIFKPSNTFILYGRFYQCFELQLPKVESFVSAWFKLNSSVFGNRTDSQNYDSFTNLHYPNQFLSSLGSKRYLPKRESNDKYIMRYRIDGVEILKRRNKKGHPCHNYNNFDASILENHIKKIGCRASYQPSVDGVPVCSNMMGMKNASWNAIESEYGIAPPCKTMESMYFSYKEADISGSRYAAHNRVDVYVYPYDQKFKEILQTRYVRTLCSASIYIDYNQYGVSIQFANYQFLIPGQ